MKPGEPVVLLILDGWGEREAKDGNAIASAFTPCFTGFAKCYAYTKLVAFGEAVGLPKGQMGNSEVGHLNIGAGRIVYQDLTRISKAVADKDFFSNKALLDAAGKVQEGKGALHLMGLLSDGGVHSHLEHLFALLEMARQQRVEKVFIHAILDGRDVPPSSAQSYLARLEAKCSELGTGKVATVAGRYWAMDRDSRWDRIGKAYSAYVYGEGRREKNAAVALREAYARGETDEFVEPVIIVGENGDPLVTVENDHSLIFFNFRPDRARQITRAFTDQEFSGFDRGCKPSFPHFLCMTEYDRKINAPVAFPPKYLVNTLGEILSQEGLLQLRIAETEKYAHVTFFFNGGIETPFKGEVRRLIPSPKVATYDLKPEMSAPAVTEAVLEELAKQAYSLIVINYANADMVGHTGKMKETVEAVETVDRCLGKVVKAVMAQGGTVLITADHGNAETMIDPGGGGIHTAHTAGCVPFILVDGHQGQSEGTLSLRSGGVLADIAPTVLDLLGIDIPPEMSGKSLIRANQE